MTRSHTDRFEHALFWLLPLFILIVLVLLRWERFGDVQVDFGQELTVAWQLSEGKHLYTDIAYYRGPLSPFVNAALMRLFGASVRTIALANLGLTLCIAYGILWLTKRATHLGMGTFAAAAFLLVFAFAQQTFVNCFNFITPFVHELTHGIVLSVLCMIALEHALSKNATVASALAGICYGLCLLTRIEMAIALTGAVGAWFAIVAWHRTVPPGRFMRMGASFIVGATIVVAIAVLPLHRYLQWSEALRSAFASYVTVFTTPISSNPFYLYVTGLNHPLQGIAVIALGSLMCAYWLLNFAIAARRLTRGDRVGTGMFVVLGMIPAIAGTFFGAPPLMLGMMLPLTTLAICVVCAWQILHRSSKDPTSERITATIAIFALLMLTKIAFAPHIRFYGFAHAMPAYLLLTICLLVWVPAHCARWFSPSARRLFVLLLSMAIIFDVFAKSVIDQRVSETKTLAIGTGSNRFFVAQNLRNRPYADFLEQAPKLIPAGSTLAAIPEGAMMNFLLQLPLSTAYTNYLPTDYIIYGKDRIIGDLHAHPPDFILLTHKDTSEFGFPLFGKMPAYGADIMSWMREHYERVAVFGDEPLQSKESYGLALWRRKQ